MSRLADQLHLRTPLTWVVSDEPHRVLEDLVALAPARPLLRIDPLRGLVRRVGAEWKIMLFDDPDGNPVGTYSPAVGITEALDSGGIFVLEHAGSGQPPLAEQLAAVLEVFTERYVTAVRADDAGALSGQVICVSHDDQVPAELARQIVRVVTELPTRDELAGLLETIEAHDDPEHLGRLVRAGQGLSEFEFLHACATCRHTHRHLVPEVLNATKIATIAAAGTLEIRTPRLAMADIGGLDQLKALLERAVWFFTHPEAAATHHVVPLRRLLLVGVPGSGKSAVCEAAASVLGLDLAKTGISQNMTKWVGESEANMRRTFRQIRALAPILLWIDEAGRDLSGGASSAAVDGGTTDRVHGEFLQGLQELPDDVFLLCAANRIDTLPPEMLRKDRFDKKIFVGFPTTAERAEILAIHLGPAAPAHDLGQLAEATPYFTGAEIKALVAECRFDVVGAEHRAITDADLIAHAGAMRDRVWTAHRPAIVAMYEQAETWDWASAAQEAERHQVLVDARTPKTPGPRPHDHRPSTYARAEDF